MKIYALLIATVISLPATAVEVRVITENSVESNLSRDQLRDIDYNDKNLQNYQDPYLVNTRAYRPNEDGVAAPAPKRNVFHVVVPATMHEDRPDKVKTDTKSFLGK